MSVLIPDDLLQAAEITEAELKLEVAILLYQHRKISGGRARQFAGLNVLEFQQELAKREICVNYDVEAFRSDLETLRRLGDL